MTVFVAYVVLENTAPKKILHPIRAIVQFDYA